jgi:glycosyltransferase involved in cell wall biosynthesis
MNGSVKSEGPLVSCIIPVYNGERFLAEAVESILAQTYQNLEIIIVDDGSTDGTASVAASFGDRVRYVRQKNSGPAAARNRGLQEARGEFIGFLDADDLWAENKLQRQLAHFRARPELAYSVTLTQNFWEKEVEGEEARFKDHARSRPMPGYVTQTLLTRREWMEKTAGFDPSLKHGDSADWFQRVHEQGAVGELLGEVLTLRRLHMENRSRLMAEGSREEFLQILKSRIDRKRGADK